MSIEDIDELVRTRMIILRAANYLAEYNEVTAIEPDEDDIKDIAFFRHLMLEKR